MVRLAGAKVKIGHGGVESSRGKVLNRAMRAILTAMVLFATVSPALAAPEPG